MNVVILHDEITAAARSDELDTLVQADTVTAALKEMGHTSVRLPISPDLRQTAADLDRLAPDLVFNLVESVQSDGRLVHLATGLLDSLGVPYTGAPTEGLFLTANKILAKRWLDAHGIATPPWVTLAASSAVVPLPARYIIKSVWEEASVGIRDDSIVDAGSIDDLHRELTARADSLGGDAFAERYIDGREFDVAMLAGDRGDHIRRVAPGEGRIRHSERSEESRVDVLPASEVRFDAFPAGKPRIVGYAAKWDAGSFEYENTPHCFRFASEDRPLIDWLERIARQCWMIFGLRGYARVDFRVDEAGSPWALEVNANPCLSPDAGFLTAAERTGVGTNDVIRRILDDAVRPSRECTTPSSKRMRS